ncbi:hypothetical protein [Thermococcus sp.]|uniref:hypothetical protein n=1 Tax=Thermococcus sp. TaxID=35749 RepID=UPI002614FA6F|nr:hypothetical protein [Thermococcus sp.]
MILSGKRRVTLRDVRNERDLVRKAYLAGYLLGYGGHTEWAGWSSRLKRAIYAEAEMEGRMKVVVTAYRRGKLDGVRAREEDIRKGIYRRLELPEPASGGESAEVMSSQRSYAPPSLRRPVFVTRPSFLREIRIIRASRILRLPRFIRWGD